jgi:hypothetical protein
MTRASGVWALDANGVGVGATQSTPVSWKAVQVGAGLNIKVTLAMYAPAVDITLRPLRSRCYQGMGYRTGLHGSYEVRVCC